MASIFEHKRFQPGEVIFRQGDPGESFYLVERGKVVVWNGSDENKRVIGEIETGGLFGEMAVLSRRPRMASASALVETQLLQMPASVLRQAINRADPLVVQLINVLMDNLRRSNRYGDTPT